MARPRKYTDPDRRNCYGERAALAAIAALGGGNFSAGVDMLYAHYVGNGRKPVRPPSTGSGRARRKKSSQP